MPATLQAIGMTPSDEAQRFLYGLALELDLEPVEGLRAHRWMCMQMANSGVLGRAVLLEGLASERDPVRRLDLIWAYATVHGDEDVREALLVLTEDDSLHPLERLFSAGRLVRVGPSHEVAPRLKRTCLRIEHPEVRKALQCMLWKWY